MADFGQSILRRLRDMYNNPELYIEQLADNLNNFNKGQVAEIRPSGAGMRQLSRDEQVDRYTRGALDNLGGGGMGALGVIKNKGGNWLTGSVENALKGLKRGNPAPTERQLELVHQRGGQEAVDRFIANGDKWNTESKADVINNWIEGPLTKYVKRDMATEGDPVRKLAEQGILHIPEDAAMSNVDSATYANRGAAGFDPWGVGESRMGRQWENIADRSIMSGFAGKMSEAARAENPWLEKLGSEDRVYQPSRIGVGETGMSHLIDELHNALNPESGLPRNLLLNPEDFQQMGMERAVRHVANINNWRAAQKAEADAMRANNAATRLHKEYPENNPMGLRWVELKASEELPEGWEAGKPSAFGEPTYRKIGTMDNHLEDPRRIALQDALKYEGDTMGHCVGGYCDDVLSGSSRIFSLRDAKGQPHVTIETRPGIVDEDLAYDPDFWERPEFKGADLSDHELIQKITQDILDKEKTPESIVQIKGKQNRAPNPEYLPFVQDFVKSGKWSNIGDLQNTGLRRSRDVWNDMEQKKISEAGHEIPEYTTMDDIKALNSKVWPGDDVYNFAEGGLVTNYQQALPEDAMPAIISNYQS